MPIIVVSWQTTNLKAKFGVDGKSHVSIASKVNTTFQLKRALGIVRYIIKKNITQRKIKLPDILSPLLILFFYTWGTPKKFLLHWISMFLFVPLPKQIQNPYVFCKLIWNFVKIWVTYKPFISLHPRTGKKCKVWSLRFHWFPREEMLHFLAVKAYEFFISFAVIFTRYFPFYLFSFSLLFFLLCQYDML